MRGETFNVAALCEISRAHNRLDARLLERVRERLHRFLTEIGQHQFGTFAREIVRDRLRNAAGCTCDQRAFAIEPIAMAISFSDSRHLQILVCPPVFYPAHYDTFLQSQTKKMIKPD